jgi:predicted PurR-regulated permease PerM
MRNLGLGAIGQFALVVAILAVGKPVLVPIALAFYLAFVLTPPSNWLERLGLPRALSVVSVVAAMIAAFAVVGSALMSQAVELARQMQTYSLQISQKLAGLRSSGFGVLGELSSGLSALSSKLDPESTAADQTTPVRIVTGGMSMFRRIEEVLGPMVEPLAMIAIVLVMTIFTLGHREDLRGRLILLVGPQNLTLATRTMGEAVNRVSHLLLTQLYINSAFSAVIALGLYVIGIPYALLWGVLAGVLRFVPMLGVLIAPVLPTLLAVAIFPGWQHALLTVGFFVVVDALVANFIEPVVLGKRTGVSALSLLISTLFWTWLWGPLGLVLATPLTVCAAVLGRHVPDLSFLAIALGDDAGLNPSVNFYQRTLAKATKEAQRLAKHEVDDRSLPAMFDSMIVPALGLMVADQDLQAIDQGAADRVVKDMDEIVERLRGSAKQSVNQTGCSIAGVAAESSADALLLKMLQATLAEQSIAMENVADPDRGKTVETIVQARPAAICIAALPPGGNANARFLCRRLRAELADAFIVVLLPEAPGKRSREAAARLREAGANGIAYEVREAARLLSARLAAA